MKLARELISRQISPCGIENLHEVFPVEEIVMVVGGFARSTVICWYFRGVSDKT
jgi:hypothetical protein